jgi:nucleoside-diphosphate-sugar epimerase
VAQLVGVDDRADGLDPALGDVEGEDAGKAALGVEGEQAWVARLAGGAHGVALMIEARGASNAKARRELGWRPAWPSWRQGFRGGLGDAYLAWKVS